MHGLFQHWKSPLAISEAVLDAEVKIGELMAKIPKNGVGRPEKNNDTAVDNLPTKTEVIKNAGFTPKQAERFQTLAKNRDIVEQAKAEARENDDAGAKQRQPQIEHYYTGEQQRFDFTDKPICTPNRSTKSMLATALLLYAAELCLLGVSVKVYIFRLCLIALKDVCKPCMM